MLKKINFRITNLSQIGVVLIPLVLFWIILLIRVSPELTQFFHTYSLGIFVAVLIAYYLIFRFLSGKLQVLACLTLTFVIFGLTLSYKWTTGYSDNKVIAGFLPYKDGAGYYAGANLILNGLPLEGVWRPLFPGFLSSMLFLMGGSLKWVLAVLVMLAATGAYCASRQIFVFWGPAPASLFITLLYFYIQPLLGLTMTELLGFTIGCYAFALLWSTACHPRYLDLTIGVLALVLALSVRAGSFFILPFLALWGGRVFRGQFKFSFQLFAMTTAVIMVGYVFVNSVFARLIGIPEGVVFGNFSYSLYGQIQGGTGWHKAIEELGTVRPDIIYKAGLQFFLAHPLSLFIGIAKAYRDFFLPGDLSIFAFNVYGKYAWFDYFAWGLTMILMLRGVFVSIKRLDSNMYSLLAAGFVGIFLSIPFLPPIDGGGRFYASTIPFLFALSVIPLGKLQQESDSQHLNAVLSSGKNYLRVGIITVFILTTCLPLVIIRTASSPSFTTPICGDGTVPFVISPQPGSYVDLISDPQGNCGLVPEICLGDFELYSIEKSVDDVYQSLYSLAISNRSIDRIIPTVNFFDNQLRFFYFPLADTPEFFSSRLMAGCAIEVETKNQMIYQVESILPDVK